MDDAIKQKITAFFAHYPREHFEKQEIVVQAGVNPKGIFYILSGYVRQYDISDRGSEIVVNVFKEPAFFPMSWAITGVTNKYFFDAATSLDVRVAPAAEVIDFLKQNPDVMFNLLARLYSGVEGLQRRMAHLMGGTAHTRVMFELIIATKRFGEKQRDGSYRIAINEEELAQRSGMTRETINRELAVFKQLELVEVEHGHMIVKDRLRLEDRLGERL